MKKFLIGFGIVLFLFLLASAGGFTYGVSLENNDAFCASCHTEPESTYYQRSQAGVPSDLAAFHHGEETRCIDCHSGNGLSGRVQAMAQGGRDWIAFQSGNYQQPAITKRPESNDSCTKCHSFSLSGGEAGEGPSIDGIRGHDGHYHATGLLVAWRVRGGPVNSCASCHPAHVEMSAAGFTNSDTINQGCDACHAQLGEGE